MSSLKTIILKYLLVFVFLVSPCCVHRDRRPDQTVSVVPSPRFVLFVFSSCYFVPVFCPSLFAAQPSRRSREFTLPFAAQRSRRSRELTPPFAAQPSRRSREFTPPFADQPAHRSQEMTPPSTANPSPPACLWLNARHPASDSMPAGLPLTQCPPACLWLKPAGSPLTQARRIAVDSSSPDCRWLMPAGRRARGKLIHHALSITPPSAAHRPRRSREITPPSVGKANPPSAVPSSSRGRPTRRPRSLGPPPSVASSSPPASAVEWSSQPVMVLPAGCGRILTRLWPKVFLTLFCVCLAPEGSWYPWAAPWIFLGGYKGPGCRGRAEGRGHGHHGPPALASWAPCSTLASVCLFRSGGPVLCGSWGVSRVPTPPPW